MVPTQKSFSIEREGDIPLGRYLRVCLVNFKDEFLILITNRGSIRYSLAEHKWEELPMIPYQKEFCEACSTGDKVYVLCTRNCTIKVLHNPGAPVSSQELLWQDIEMPKDNPIPRYSPTFVPLNSTEIVIAGGMDTNYKEVRDIVIFDTTTCEFKKEAVNTFSFECYLNQSANFCENTIVALVHEANSPL